MSQMKSSTLGSAGAALTCRRPGCVSAVFPTGEPDTVWCVAHGEQYVAEPLDIPDVMRHDRAGEAKSRRDIDKRPPVR